MALSTIRGTAPFMGGKPTPISEGKQGRIGGLRNKEAVVTGAAVSRSATNTTAALLDIWLYGNSSARAEFLGVVATDGAAPTLSIAASANDDEVVDVITDGYAKVLLAAGQTVRKGQWLEPIPDATGHFRVASGGHGVAFAESDVDNSAGSVAVFCGAFIRQDDIASGVVGSAGISATITGVAVETAYAGTVDIPRNPRVGDLFRISGCARGLNGAAGNNTIKGYIDGIGSTEIFTSPAVTFNANDVCTWSIYVRIVSLGAGGTMSVWGEVGFGAPGTATMRAQGSAGAVTIDTTQANTVTIAVTPNNNADQSRLEGLVVEKLN